MKVDEQVRIAWSTIDASLAPWVKYFADLVEEDF